MDSIKFAILEFCPVRLVSNPQTKKNLCVSQSYKDLIWFLVFNANFSYFMVNSFSGGRSRSTQREPPTMGKQLVNFITCGCESSAPFFVIYKARCEPMPYWWKACMSSKVIQLPNSLSHPGPSYKEVIHIFGLNQVWRFCKFSHNKWTMLVAILDYHQHTTYLKQIKGSCNDQVWVLLGRRL